jgi:hypothetical protein
MLASSVGALAEMRGLIFELRRAAWPKRPGFGSARHASAMSARESAAIGVTGPTERLSPLCAHKALYEGSFPDDGLPVCEPAASASPRRELSRYPGQKRQCE